MSLYPPEVWLLFVLVTPVIGVGVVVVFVRTDLLVVMLTDPVLCATTTTTNCAPLTVIGMLRVLVRPGRIRFDQTIRSNPTHRFAHSVPRNHSPGTTRHREHLGTRASGLLS